MEKEWAIISTFSRRLIKPIKGHGNAGSLLFFSRERIKPGTITLEKVDFINIKFHYFLINALSKMGLKTGAEIQLSRCRQLEETGCFSFMEGSLSSGVMLEGIKGIDRILQFRLRLQLSPRKLGLHRRYIRRRFESLGLSWHFGLYSKPKNQFGSYFNVILSWKLIHWKREFWSSKINGCQKWQPPTLSPTRCLPLPIKSGNDPGRATIWNSLIYIYAICLCCRVNVGTLTNHSFLNPWAIHLMVCIIIRITPSICK